MAQISVGGSLGIAEKTECGTAERRKEAWQRQLKRVQVKRIHLEKMRDEIAASPKIEILFRNPSPQTKDKMRLSSESDEFIDSGLESGKNIPDYDNRHSKSQKSNVSMSSRQLAAKP